MSVNALPKFNRGGLSGTTFGQRSSGKTTSGTSKQKAPSSISVSARHYSLKKKNGIGTEISRGTTADYTALRRTNSTRGARYSSGVDSSFMTNAAVRMGMIQGAYGMQQGGMTTGMAILNSVGTIAQGLFGGVQTKSAALDASMNSLGGGKFGAADITDPNLSASVNKMLAATDSQALDGAIKEAKTKLGDLKKQGPELKSAHDDAMKNADTYKGNMTSAKGILDKANTAVSEADGRVNGAQDAVTQQKGLLEGAKEKDNTARNNYIDAKGALATAKGQASAAGARVDSLQSQLDSIPDDADHAAQRSAVNAQLTAAKQAKQQADQAVTNAERKLGEAKTACEAAKQNVADIDNAVDAAVKGLETAEKGLAKAKADKTDAEKDQKTAKENYDKAKDLYDKAEKAINTYKEHIRNASGLETVIKEQEGRLKQLQRAEKKQGSTPANNNKGTQGASDNGTVMTAEQFKNKLTTGDGAGITGFKDIGTAVCGQGPDGKMAYYMKDGTPLDQATFEQMEQNAKKLGGEINIPQDPFANQMA